MSTWFVHPKNSKITQKFDYETMCATTLNFFKNFTVRWFLFNWSIVNNEGFHNLIYQTFIEIILNKVYTKYVILKNSKIREIFWTTFCEFEVSRSHFQTLFCSKHIFMRRIHNLRWLAIPPPNVNDDKIDSHFRKLSTTELFPSQ